MTVADPQDHGEGHRGGHTIAGTGPVETAGHPRSLHRIDADAERGGWCDIGE